MKFRKLRREAKSFFLSGSIERNEDILDILNIDDEMSPGNPVNITIDSIPDYQLGAKRNKFSHNVLWLKTVNETFEKDYFFVLRKKFTLFNAKLGIVAKATGYKVATDYIFDEVLKKQVVYFFDGEDGETGQSEYELAVAIPLDLINRHREIFLLTRLEVSKKYRKEGVATLLMERILEDNPQIILKPCPLTESEVESKDSGDEDIQTEDIKCFYKAVVEKNKNYNLKTFRSDFDDCEYMLIADSFMVKNE